MLSHRVHSELFLLSVSQPPIVLGFGVILRQTIPNTNFLLTVFDYLLYPLASTHHAKLSCHVHFEKVKFLILQHFISSLMFKLEWFLLNYRLTGSLLRWTFWTVGLFAVASCFIAFLLCFIVFVMDILTSVTIFAKSILKEVVTKFSFVFEVEGVLFSHFLLIVSKSALK